jgi:hypothetical protein
MKHKRAQVGMEFLIIIGALFLFISIFLLTIQEDTREERYLSENIMVREVALIAQNEINLALESQDGYSREFDLPEKIGNMDYAIIIDSKIIYIKTTDNKHALILPITNVTGSLNITHNKIQKINGTIYIN